MANSKTANAIENLLTKALSSPKYGRKLLEGQGLDPARLLLNAPVDDREPPAPVPQDEIRITPFMAALSLEWPVPDEKDYVTHSIVELQKRNPDGIGWGTSVEYTGNQSGIDIIELEGGTEYRFRVRLVDLWNRLSPFTAFINAIPNRTADYEIDLEYALAQGNLQGLIPAINVEGSTAQEGIQAASLAAALNPNMLTMLEVDVEDWPVGPWPPEDARKVTNSPEAGDTEPAFLASLGNGVSFSVTSYQERKWLTQSRSAGSTAVWGIPWDILSPRGTIPGNKYFYSAYCRGPANKRVRLSVLNTGGSTSTNATVEASSPWVTLGGNDAPPKRLFVNFTEHITRQNIVLRLEVEEANTTVHWTKFQLEYAGEKTEPSPWSAPVISAGVVSARVLLALTANVANAVIGKAAIRNAHISTLDATKIRTGELIAGQIITIKGEIAAGGAKLTEDGIVLNEPAGEFWPDDDARQGDWITPRTNDVLPSPHSGIAFFTNPDASPPTRGMYLTSLGVSDTTRVGAIRVLATPGSKNLASDRLALVYLVASNNGLGEVRLAHKVNVQGPLNVAGSLIVEEGNGVSLPTGTIGNAELGENAVTGFTLSPSSLNHTHFPNIAEVGRILPAEVSVRPINIPDFSITGAKLENGTIVGAKIGDGEVGRTKLPDDVINAPKILNGEVLRAKIADDAVDSAKIAANAVTRTKIIDDAVDGAKIAANSITRSKIINDAVDGSKIAANSIASNHLTNLIVGNEHLKDDSVGKEKMKSGSVDNGQLVNGAVGEDKLHTSIKNGGDGVNSARTIGLGNGPGAAGANHSHGGSVSTSLRFMVLPRPLREKLINARRVLELAVKNNSQVGQQELRALMVSMLGMMHTTWDGLTEHMADRHTRHGSYDTIPEWLEPTMWEMYWTERDKNTTVDIDALPLDNLLLDSDKPHGATVQRYANKPRFVRDIWDILK